MMNYETIPRGWNLRRPNPRATGKLVLAGLAATSIGLFACEQETPEDEIGYEYEGAGEVYQDPAQEFVDEGADIIGEGVETIGEGAAATGNYIAGAARDTGEMIDAGFFAFQTGVEAQGEMMLSTLEFPLADGASLLVETQSPAQVRVGESFSYEVAVTNGSDFPLHDVVVYQYLPSMGTSGQQSGMQNRQGSGGQAQGGQQQQQQQQQQRNAGQSQGGQSSGAMSQSNEGQPNAWRIGMLRPGETVNNTIEGIAQREGQMAVCMTVDYQPSVCTMIDVVAPELALARMIVDADGRPLNEAFICDDFWIVYEVRNIGSGQTEPILITEDLPQGLSANGSQQVSLSVEPLSPGESATADVKINATQSTTFNSYAIARTEETGMQVRSDETAVRILNPQIELMVDGPQRTYDTRPVTYSITVRNTSDAPALDTVVRVPVPEQAQRVSLSSQNLGPEAEAGIFQVGRLNPGESRSFDLTFEAGNIGDIVLTATAQAYCADAVEKQVMTQVVGVPAIRLETVDLVDPVPQGDTTTYVVRVKNQGTAEDLNVQVRAQLPDKLEYVSGQGDTNITLEGGMIVFAPIDRLDPGEIAEWQITARATATGKVRFELEMVSDANSRPIVEQEPTTLY